MNLLRKLSLFAAFALGALSLRAQTVIDLSAYIDEDTAAQLGESNAAALRNKISKIITRNGMADAAGLFVVTPTLTVTDDGTVDTGMTTVHVVRADLTLSVKNLFENTVFASQTVSLQANGKSEEACMRSLINKVNVNDVRFAKMIKDVQQSIADYYTRQMPKILSKINSLVARGEYEDAMAALAVVPLVQSGKPQLRRGRPLPEPARRAGRGRRSRRSGAGAAQDGRRAAARTHAAGGRGRSQDAEADQGRFL